MKYFLLHITSLIQTFSRVESSKEIDFELYYDNISLKESSDFSIGDIILISQENKVFFNLTITSINEEKLTLKKNFEIEKQIDIEENEVNSPIELTSEEYNNICYSIFNYYANSNEVIDNKIVYKNYLPEFIEWFISKDGLSHNYYNKFFSSNKDKLKEELSYYNSLYKKDFKQDVFELNPNDIENKIEQIKRNFDQQEGYFFEFSSSKPNHMPRAILGKNNYLKFLNEKFSNGFKVEQLDHFTINNFQNSTKSAGLTYSNQLITRYISSLATKPFVLLSGLSGSGKTKLAQSYAQWICENEKQYCIVPVGADWTNREPLLGYVNALNPEEYILPENGALQLIIEANKTENQNKPYFLILDEMNLSHVERYFADFLSVMESKDKFKLHSDKENEKSRVPYELGWSKNLFIIGTVNIDETTYMFSPKVLDRANVIEFRVSETEISDFLSSPKEIDLSQLKTKGATMASSFIEIAKNKDFEEVDTTQLNASLKEFFVQLQKSGAEFGYRTAMEIHRLYQQVSVINNTISQNEKIDIAIMQKLLPKLHGSRRKLCPILEVLAKFCVEENIDFKKDFLENKDFNLYKKVDDKLVLKGSILYPLSLEKITRMYQGAIENGFASYAEA